MLSGGRSRGEGEGWGRTIKEVHKRVLEINRKMAGKSKNTLRLKNTLLINTWVKKKVSREIENYFTLNKNENATYRNWYVAEKAMLT